MAVDFAESRLVRRGWRIVGRGWARCRKMGWSPYSVRRIFRPKNTRTCSVRFVILASSKLDVGPGLDREHARCLVAASKTAEDAGGRVSKSQDQDEASLSRPRCWARTEVCWAGGRSGSGERYGAEFLILPPIHRELLDFPSEAGRRTVPLVRGRVCFVPV